MSGLEIAASVATIIQIVPLCQKIFKSVKNHLKRSSPEDLILPQHPLIPSEILELEEAMGDIQLFLHLSKSIEEKIGDLPEFVTQLRKAAYAAEDLLDELDYEHLQLKVLANKEGSTLRAEADTLNVAIGTEKGMATGAAAVQLSPGAGSSSCSSKTSQVGFIARLKLFFRKPTPPPPLPPLPPESLHLSSSRSKITAERIRTTIDDLNRAASRLRDIYPLISESSRTTGGWKEKGSAMVITGSRVTTSTVNASRVHGRDEKKKEIIDMLETPQIHGLRISIIAIVGVGGVGKTTLAQYVFNDEKLDTLFQHKVWICVSDEYIKEKIIKEFIIDTAESREKTSIELQSITSMDTLERMLKNNVKNKILLLVLDDVWSDQWTEILLLLHDIVELCKIIVTTREEKNVMLPVQFAHFQREILVLEGLDEAVYRTLFDEHVFGIQGPSGHSKGAMLQPIGWEIAKKLKGSPLAAKTVGAVLRERLDVDHWTRVQGSDLWSVGNQKTDDIMPALMLSYLHLPTRLQRCFSYCAIFPKDYEFLKEDLINMWIAQSYVSCNRQDERPEDVGLRHFEDLVSRSFFTYYKESYRPCYKMHDLLHDLALFVSLKECCVYHSGIWHGNPRTCRHLSITESHKLPENLTEHLLESMKLQLEHVRTLIIDSFEKAQEILKSMKRVRVVKVLKYSYRRKKNRLHDIGHLIHLRYLDLSIIHIFNVTESICTLYHLDTLLFNTHEITMRFPEQMCNLVNLRHLFASKPSIARIPFIGKLSQLRELEYFNCEYNNIGQLKEMNELGGELCIMNMERTESTHDAKNASLCKKRRLKELKLKWGNNTIYNDAFAEHHDTVLQFLQPNEQLEVLRIRGHPGCKSPSWIAPSSLRYIQRIYLSSCSHWDKLSGIAKLPHLEHLSMIDMRLVIELGDEDPFPSLVEIVLNNVSLSFKKSQVHGRMFPKLRLMDLSYCKKLEGLTMPSSLEILSVEKSDVELPGFLKGLSFLTTLKIVNQDGFTTFDREVMDSLSSLKELTIWHCKNFRSLPKGGLPGSLVKLDVVR